MSDSTLQGEGKGTLDRPGLHRNHRKQGAVNEALIKAVAELISAGQVPRSMGLLRQIAMERQWDDVVSELGLFGYPSAEEIADALRSRIGVAP